MAELVGKAEVLVRVMPPSEGTAELIERLIVLRLKLAAVREPGRRARLLDAAARVYADLDARRGEAPAKRVDALALFVAERGLFPLVEHEWERTVARLAMANKRLWELKDRQAVAVARRETDATLLLTMLSADIDLCQERAHLRAELAARLGEAPSGESVKLYGGAEVPTEPAAR